MIIQISPTDTSISYKCDWQFAQMENNPETANGAAEHYAVFFMAMDKLVFGYTKFNITDSNLFRTAEHGKALQVKISSNSSNNNLYDIIELCEEMVIWYEDCQYADTDACSSGCDRCQLCMQSFVMDYCWEEYVWTGGGETGGGTGSTGGGGTPTPPNPCNGTPDNPQPFARGNVDESNVVDPCGGTGGGWAPVPLEDDPPCNIILENNCITSSNYPGKELGYPYMWWTDNTWLINNFRFSSIAPTENLTPVELILINYFPFAALRIKSNASKAELETINRFGSNGLNDKSDAFRHAYWLALNTKYVGAEKAKLFSDAHETQVPLKFILEKQMDLHNNAVGISLCPQDALTEAYLSQTAWQSVLNGELNYLSPIDYSDTCYWGCQGNTSGTHGITSSTQIKPTNQ